MAGKEGKSALVRCTAEGKGATSEEGSTKHTLGRCTTSATDGERCTTEPMEATRGDAVSVAAAVEATEPMVVDTAKATLSEPQAEGGIQEEFYEPQAEEAEYTDDYQDDAEVDYDCEEQEYDYEPQFEEERPKVRAVLLNFPEAADLEPHELDTAVDRILEQSKPEYADVAAPGKIRLLKEDIGLALDQWRAPPPSIIHDQASKDRLPADLILRMEELDKEYLPLYGKAEDELDQFRAKVRKELIEKGYVEVDEDYYDKQDEFERQMMQQIEEEWNQKIDISRFRVANNEEGICYYSEEHGGYI